MSPAGRLAGVLLCLVVVGCSGAEEGVDSPAVEAAAANRVPDVQATNAFYYYRDVDAAWAFYRDVLGFETVADFGFAKIMRVADASYLTLVDETQGRHSADDPKSVTLAIVTEQVEGWYDYLTEMDVPMRGPLRVEEGTAHDGFVAIDPEGYLLEFERFNPHAENVDLMPMLAAAQAVGPHASGRPADLEVVATVLWLYYDDIPGAQAFYESLLGVPLLVDQGWAKVYRGSDTGFIGLVDGERGLHQATETKAVTISFLTSELTEWYERAQSLGVRTEALSNESGRVALFVGHDPEGYVLEWDHFLDPPGNQRLLDLLAGDGG